jgi:hypothetical protein
MIVTVYLDWTEGYDPKFAAAFARPIAVPPATDRWRIDIDVSTGEVSARKATVEECGNLLGFT